MAMCEGVIRSGGRKRGRCLIVRVALLWISLGPMALAGEGASVRLDAADVVVDGHAIVAVRGIAGLPAEERARAIADRIMAVAADENIAPGDVGVTAKADHTELTAGGKLLLALFDADAEIEGVSRQVLAYATQLRLQSALTNYRFDRSPRVLAINSVYAAGAIALSAALWFGFRRGFHSLDRMVVQHLRDHLKALEAQSARFVKAQQLARFVRGLLRLLHTTLLALTAYISLNFVLGLYPWTRPFAVWLFGLVLDPLRTMADALLAAIPDLAFLAILFFVTRYILRMIRTFFEGIDSGAIQLAAFEQEWAWPTYRILRLLVVIFAMVVAYPYVPGSQSEAFKGISLLLGLIVSLGSSSIIANIIAGYSLAYRRPFRIGDRVRINDTLGDVMEMRVLVTRLRSLKNEEIVIPNTSILNGEVINYTTLAEERGLILHTAVGIGYETPWRQVEAMLHLAANRTPGLLKKPEPFVLQTGLGDFAVTYELNAHCNDPTAMPQLYSALHRNILEVFNEYGVAIMTPAYVSDPAEPKIVPKDQWYASPATPHAGAGGG
jgi:small-conductance mechanosensitive channel